MKYFLYLFLLFTVSIAGAEEQSPEITMDPSGYVKGSTTLEPGKFVTELPDTTVQHPRYQLNRIVAIVNNDVVLSSELGAAMDEIIRQLQAKGTPIPEHAVLLKQVLERLVVESLQLQIAADNGVTVSDSMLNSEIQSLARENNVSLAEFRNILERDGYSYADFRNTVQALRVPENI